MKNIDEDSIVIPAAESDNDEYVRGYIDGYIQGFKEDLVTGTEVIADEFDGINYVHTKDKASDEDAIGT